MGAISAAATMKLFKKIIANEVNWDKFKFDGSTRRTSE